MAIDKNNQCAISPAQVLIGSAKKVNNDIFKKLNDVINIAPPTVIKKR